MNDQITKVLTFVQNSIVSARASLAARAGKMYDGRRDVWKILGYKETLDVKDFMAMYEREDVAGRIVDMPCQETWRNPPKLVPKIEGQPGEFFTAFDEIADRLSVYPMLEKVDILSGIGRYGILLVGIADGKDLDQPVTFSEEKKIKPEDIIYLQAYDESRVQILELDTDEKSARFGLPVMYEIEILNVVDTKAAQTTKTPGGQTQLRKKVHWSRVIHVAEDTLSNKIYGRPRLQRVFNRMWDMLKITGGSAEMFWQNVAQIFHVNLDPELEYKQSDLEALDKKFQEMLQGLRRIIQTEGIKEIKPLQGQTPDPRGVFSVLKTLIASSAEIPQRILFGSEQGEMASTQDKSEWYGRIASRRQRHAYPNILLQLILRWASWGVFTLPAGGIKAEWPSLFEETPQEKANNARILAMAANKFDAKRPDRLIGVAEIREAAGLPRILPDDVKKALEEEDARREEEAEKALEQAEREAAAAAQSEPPQNDPPQGD